MPSALFWLTLKLEISQLVVPSLKKYKFSNEFPFLGPLEVWKLRYHLSKYDFSRPAETDPLQRLLIQRAPYNDEDGIECPTQGLRKWFSHASSYSTKLDWSAQSHTTTENRIKYDLERSESLILILDPES